MSKIDVYLEKEIYTAGEKVKGTLYIDQNVHIDIEGILLLARGLAILNTFGNFIRFLNWFIERMVVFIIPAV